MKYFYLSLLFLIVVNFNGRVQAQVTSVWSDDFESDKGWVFTGEFERGNPSGGNGDHGNANPTSAFSGNVIIGTDLDGGYSDDLTDREYTAISPTINCSGKENVILNFQQWLNVEQSQYDHAYIDVYDGSVWSTVWENGNVTINDNSWSQQSIDISAYADNNSNVKIRFALGSTDNMWNFSGWNIDDIELTSSPDPVNGDYRTRRTNNWNSNNTWQQYNGSWWNNTNDDPGERGDAVSVTIQSGHTITVNQNRPSSNYTIQNLGIESGGTLRYDTNIRTLTLEGGVTGGGTVDMTRNNRAHSLTVGGDFLPGTFNAGSANVILNGTSTQKIGGFTYNNLTISGGDKELQGDITINGTLNLSGAKIVLGDYDLIITDGASISGTFSSINMIVTNGTGRLIKEGNANADYEMVYPVGTGSYYTPYEITSIACSDATGSVEVRAVSGVAPGPPSAESTDLQKYWEVSENEITITSADVAFTYDNSEVGSGGNQSSYGLQVYSGGAWVDPSGVSEQGSNPMTASGISDISGVWTALEQSPQIIYYSYRSGSWNNISTWTHDPGGTTQTATDIPEDGAKVVILNGRNVTLTSDVTNSGISVAILSGGFLDMSTYKFTNNLNEVSGNGTLKLASNNFPSSSNNYLVTENGGTVEYNNSSNFNLPSSQAEYNHLVINCSSVATQKHDINIHGNLQVKQGTYRINDGSAARYELTIEGDVSVEAAGTIAVGTGNTIADDVSGGTAPFIDYYDKQTHRVVINGDFTNNGSVRFTNQSYPQYKAFPTNGAATVYFMGATDNTLTCNSQTDFYNLVLDKGTDQTFKLTVYSSSYSNFRLFGRNSYGGDTSASGGSDQNPNLRKALWIRTGTMVLQGLTVIPSLTEGGGDGDPNSDFYIPVNGALVLDGTDVVVLSTADDYTEVNAAYGLTGGSNNAYGTNEGSDPQSFSIYGKVQINDGYFSTRESGGFITWDIASGEFIVNGGTVDAKQFRAAGESGGLASYTQTGGTVILRGQFQRSTTSLSSVSDLVNAPLDLTRKTDGLDESKGTLNINNPDNIFSMSGGNVQILGLCGTIDGYYGYAIDIFSAKKNINVSGGTFEIAAQEGNNTFKVRSAAPLGNLMIDRSAGGSQVQLDNINLPTGVAVSGDLTVLEDITLINGVFNANGFDVTVGSDFSIAEGTTYTTGDNHTIFNGSEEQKLIVDLTSALSLNKLVVNNTSDKLLLKGEQDIVNIVDSLIISSGELDDNGKTINVSGNIYNAGLHTGDGKIVMKGSSINGNGSGEFSNILLNRNGEISLDANAKINGVLTFGQDYLFNIGTNNISFSEDASISGSSDLRYIKSAGNAGDGGVTFSYNSATSKSWPIGVDVYSPATIGFTSAPTTYGDITIVPVNYEHPVTTTDGEALSYFWRIKSTGFSGIEGKVSHVFHYDQSDVHGNEAAYLPARYNAATYEWNKGTIDDVDETGTINEIDDWTTPTQSADYIDGDYTDGLNSAFGTPQKYYSRRDGLWRDVTTWSTVGHTGAAASNIPSSGDIVIIGNGNEVSLRRWDNTANRDPQYCASLQIEDGAILDVTYNPGSDFGMVVSHPSGNGKIRISVNDNSGSIFQFPGGDFSDFNANLGTTELYTNNSNSGTTYWLPDGVSEYGNLMITPLGGSNIIFPNNNVTILGDLTADGQSSESWYCPTWDSDYPNGFTNRSRQAKTITIKGDFDLIGGALIYYGNRNWSQDFIIDGDLKVSEDAGIGVYSNANSQTISIGGSLINNAREPRNGEDTYRGCDFEDIPLTFTGNNDAKITQSSDVSYTTYTYIESITINKGTSQATTLTMDIAGTVNYESDEWLSLLNGTFIYNRNSDVSIYSGDSFTIPGTSGLKINTGNTFNLCRGNNNDYDVYLNGKLTVVNGTVNIGTASNNSNNDIEYSGAGLSEIEVQAGSLFINGQVRRNPASSAGILKYNQSGGAVTINGRNTLTTNAKLEILNAGSEFNMSGGTITIVRGGGTTYGDLYIRPENSEVTGGEIIFDNSGVGAQNYLLDANVNLNDLTVYGNGSDATIKLLLSPLTLNGDLTLSNSNSILDANSAYNVAVTIKGDFNNNGVYQYYENTTSFTGTTQQITGSSNIEFYDLVVNPLTSLILTKDVTINNQLTISSGTLAVGANTINAKGDVVNNSTYTSTGSGLVLNGVDSQELSGTGTFARLELDNSSGATLANEISVVGELALTRGVLNIKNYLLSLEESASIAGSFGVGNMIVTNGVFSNSGIKKVMSSGDTPAFTFPIGVDGKYTPAVLDLSASSNVASIQIHPVDYKHPANIDDENVLDYFWAVESEALNNASGVLTFTYLDEDVLGDESNYYAARLLVPGSSWTKNNTVDKENNIISFTVSGDNISGEYTAGLETAFPDNVPQFTSNSNGDWSNPDIWTQTGGDSYILTGAPNGFIVIVENDVALDENFAQAYRTTINSDGKLMIDAITYGHNLGSVSGSGTIYLEQGNLPEGIYDDFLGCNNNSTLEFGGSGDYFILSDLFNNAANLIFSGSGSRTLPDADLNVCKQLLIDGPILDNSVYNRTLYVNGTFVRQSGTFKSGTGDNATVSFTGSVEQSISDFTGTNTLNNLEINNSAGLTLDGEIEVAGKLLLTDGLINTTATNLLIITNTSTDCVTPSTGKASSYVNGPLTKKMNQSDSFQFPIGIDGELGSKMKITAVQTGTKLWTAEYKRPNDTYTNYTFPLTAINSHEYWTLSTPGGGRAKVQLGWDAGSDITPAMTEHGLTDIRVVNYDGSEWQEIASSASGSDASGVVITTSRVSVEESGSDFTTATVNTNKPKIRFNPDGSVCDLTTGIKVDLISTVPTTAGYELSYTIDGVQQESLTITNFPYYLPTPTVGVYGLTGFKYDNKVRDGVVDVTTVTVFPSPTTADAGDNQSLQGLTQATLDANVAEVGIGVWSIVSGTGGSFIDPTDPVTKFNGTAGSSYVLSWTIINGDCQSVDQVNIAFPLLPPHVWLGNTNDWFDTDNWSDGIIPDETTDISLNAVTAPKVDAVVNSTAVAKVKNLTIESNATLTLGEGSRMTVNGDVTIEDDCSLIIHNVYNNPASLINNGSVSNPVQIEWEYPKLQYLYLAHAVDGATVGDYGVPKTDQFVYSYPNNWSTYIRDVNMALDGELTGYSAILANDATITTKGMMYDQDQSVALGDRWNLLGNTFTSYLDLSASNAWDFGNAQQTIWYRILSTNTAVEEYLSVNVAEGVTLNGADSYIAPGQAFWVRSYEETNIAVSSSARVHGSGGLKSTRSSSADVFRLTISNSNGDDELAVLFRSTGSETPANNDSEKFMGSGKVIPQVYTVKGNKKMAVNVLPVLTGDRSVALGYKVGEDALTNLAFNATNISTFLPGVNVTIEDTESEVTYDLRETSVISFTSDATTSSDRFVLHFSSVSTDIDASTGADSERVDISLDNQSLLSISCDWDEYEKYVTIYSIDGRKVFQGTMLGEAYSKLLSFKPGIYIVHLSADTNHYQEKVRVY